MISDLDIYTGTLEYRGISFTFVFDKEILRLIPPKHERHNVDMWFTKPIGDGAYTMGDPIYVEESYLVGACNETKRNLVFYPAHINIGKYNSVLKISIEAYLIMDYDREYTDRIGFMSPEIDFIYSTHKAIESFQQSSEGVFSVQTHDFTETTSEPREFRFEEKAIKVYFGISRNYSQKAGKPPLELHSIMFFEFEKTDDYAFLIKLYRIAKQFIQYLVYRQNIEFTTIQVASPFQSNKHENYAVIRITDNRFDDKIKDNELELLEKGRYIKQEYISGAEGMILDDIANFRIYLRHIPRSYLSGCHVNEASFVMVTAAFEWTFNREYPDGIKKSEARIIAEQVAFEDISKLKDNASGKLKEIYKYLLKHTHDDSLKPKIIQVGQDYSEIISAFGNHLYSINNENLDYSEIGTRIAEQRNNFAHGNLDKEFIGTSLLDVIYLERIIYAMQLKKYRIENMQIQKAINDLFGAHLAI